MPPTTGYRLGDIVLVPFPFTDQPATKRRPAVVGNERYNRERPDLVIMAVTSHAQPIGSLGEVQVKDWQAAGRRHPQGLPDEQEDDPYYSSSDWSGGHAQRGAALASGDGRGRESDRIRRAHVALEGRLQQTGVRSEMTVFAPRPIRLVATG